jgi:hypothetical protein
MSIRPACQCGRLARHAQDPGMPYRYHPETNSYSLVLSPEVTVEKAYCVFCGGHAAGPQTQDPPPCLCGALDRWVRDPAIRIEWGTIGRGMYGLWCQGKHYQGLAIWFCPACGGRVRDEAWEPA